MMNLLKLGWVERSETHQKYLAQFNPLNKVEPRVNNLFCICTKGSKLMRTELAEAKIVELQKELNQPGRVGNVFLLPTIENNRNIKYCCFAVLL